MIINSIIQIIKLLLNLYNRLLTEIIYIYIIQNSEGL